MIWESSFWKSDLIKDAEILIGLENKKLTDRRYVLLEKTIFISAYSIRKLIESEKIGSDLPNDLWNLLCEEYPRKNVDKQLTLFNNHQLQEFYELEKPKKKIISLKDLCNTIIHSYIFMPQVADEGFIDSFLINSDNNKNKHVLRIDYKVFITILQRIGHCDVSEQILKKDDTFPLGFKIIRKYSFRN